MEVISVPGANKSKIDALLLEELIESVLFEFPTDVELVMHDDIRVQLYNYYKKDIIKTELLTGLDLSDWKQ